MGRLTKAVVNQVIELCKCGKASIQEIMDDTQISYSTALLYMKKYGPKDGGSKVIRFRRARGDGYLGDGGIPAPIVRLSDNYILYLANLLDNECTLATRIRLIRENTNLGELSQALRDLVKLRKDQGTSINGASQINPALKNIIKAIT